MGKNYIKKRNIRKNIRKNHNFSTGRRELIMVPVKRNLNEYFSSEAFKTTVGYFIKNIDLDILKKEGIMRSKSLRSLEQSKKRMYASFELDWHLPISELYDIKEEAWEIIKEAVKDYSQDYVIDFKFIDESEELEIMNILLEDFWKEKDN